MGLSGEQNYQGYQMAMRTRNNLMDPGVYHMAADTAISGAGAVKAGATKGKEVYKRATEKK